MPITITDKAASEVKRIIQEQRAADPTLGKIYLRLRVIGGGHSGLQHKLDLDPVVNDKLDELFEYHGVPTVVDKRSLLYLENATVDFHDNTGRHGFSISTGKSGTSGPPKTGAARSPALCPAKCNRACRPSPALRPSRWIWFGIPPGA